MIRRLVYLKKYELYVCKSCGYSDYAEDITDSYQCPRCHGLMVKD